MSDLDLSSMRPARVELTQPDGSKKEVLRVPTREVFEVHEEKKP